MQDNNPANVIATSDSRESPEIIPISLCFDVEPNERCPDPGNPVPWSGFEILYSYMEEMRGLLVAAVGTQPNFCWSLRLDPQIEQTYGSADWAARHYREIFDSLLAKGDEIGIHAHGWRWGPEEENWIGDYDNDSWLEHCVRMSCHVYEEWFGRAARVFRFGDRFMTNKIMALLEEAGILCDLTPEPGHHAVQRLAPNELTTGWIPDYRTAPRSPYHPSPMDFRIPARDGQRNIWVLPLSTGQPGAIDQAQPLEPEWLTMVMGFPFPALRDILAQILSGSSQPHIVAVARTDVTVHPQTRDQFELLLNHLAEHPLRERFRFTTPLETVRILTERTENRAP